MKMISMSFRRLLPCAAIVPLLFGACAAPAVEADEGAGPVEVVTTFYPLQFATEQVGGPDVTVTDLTPPGTEPHDLELTPRQVAAIADADLVVYLAGLQPAVDRAIAENATGTVLEVGALVPAPSPGADHADEPGHTEEPGHDHDHGGHDHGGRDPHLWLDPENMERIGSGIAAALSDLDPDDAAGYADRDATFDARLTDLDERFRTGLARCETRAFITSHEAFGHLAARYDLEQIAIRGLSADEEPSPARIAAVQQAARDHDIDTIFYETLVSPEVSESVARDLGLRTAVLDPIEGLADASTGANYFSIMDANLAALRGANRCR